jgi:hypothetical protein
MTSGAYAAKRAALEQSWRNDGGELRLAKSTISNLFRYQARGRPQQRLSLGHFNQIIALDEARGTLEVEGLATFEQIVSFTLEHGFLPLVAPELKHITIGGATVGIGIESTCFRYGFVHDSLLEADVLLPGGRVVTCTADNEHADLFHALPNSYGTLGYILRAKIRLHRARPYTRIAIEAFATPTAYLDAMAAATREPDIDFVEGLFYEDRRFLLIRGWMQDEVPTVDDIVRENIYYRLVDSREEICLKTFDYIFRYDPEWFWNLPETPFYRLFRRYAPLSMRNSGYYTRHLALEGKVRGALGMNTKKDTEPLIQDWEVPWLHAGELIEFCLEHVDLGGRPWAAVPIVTPTQPTLYPIRPNELYFNLGCYCQVHRPEGRPPYYYTRIIDDKCFELDGIKMLYSSTFLDEDSFDARFNGPAYAAIKQKYDPDGRAPTLYAKVAMPG